MMNDESGSVNVFVSCAATFLTSSIAVVDRVYVVLVYNFKKQKGLPVQRLELWDPA
jgi:hypothetical protein